jgi:hypothetical protein
MVKQVKGSMIKLTVKIMRLNKTGVYEKMLSDKAKELYNERILDPVWYSFEPYKECYNALCQVEANNDPRILMQWGRARGEELMTTIYHSVKNVNIKTALYGYARFYRSVYNFGEVLGEFISDHELQVTFKDLDSGWKNFTYTAIGWVHRFFELCINKKITTEADNSTVFSLTWA